MNVEKVLSGDSWNKKRKSVKWRKCVSRQILHKYMEDNKSYTKAKYQQNYEFLFHGRTNAVFNWEN